MFTPRLVRSGNLEVGDFALSISGGVATIGSATPTSISKTSQTVWVLGFSTSGIANGSETISVVPAAGNSIYDAADNAAATSQSNNTAALNEKVVPIITGTTVNSANSQVTVTFAENVYNATGATGDLEVGDFALSISGGVATIGSVTPTSISKTSQSVWVLDFSTSVPANGSETIAVVPAANNSIYDAADNAATTSQSNNTSSLNDLAVPTITGTTVNSTNSELTVTFSENVYSAISGSGDLEVGDFALSISGGVATPVSATPTSIAKTSQTVWVLGFSTSVPANGAETITVVPVSNSIYDGSDNIAATSQSNNTAVLNDKAVPIIISATSNFNNTEMTVTFAENVYDTNGGSGNLKVGDFALSISGGVATIVAATPESISKTSQTVWVLGYSTSGTPDGSETITVVPIDDSIYDVAGNEASTSQSNNTTGLNEKVLPVIASTTVNSDNSELTVTFAENVYNATGASGDLEVGDFALSISGGVATIGSATPTSISKTSQSVWVLGFSTSGIANGSEIISVVPVSNSIYDPNDNLAATSQSNNTTPFFEKVAATITGMTVNSINSELTVIFSENVYNVAGGSGDLEVGDFAISISGGVATPVSATPTSISKTSQSIWVLGFSTSGPASGAETITIAPVSNSIYDVTDNVTATSQSNNTAALNDKLSPTLTSVSIASNYSTNTQASINDEITVSFTTSENIQAPSGADVVFFSGSDAVADGTTTYTGSGTTWTATYTAHADDTDGLVSFTIAFDDVLGNAGTNVTAVTNSSSVTFDKTVPTLSDVGIASNNSTDTLAIVNDVITVTFTAIEAIGTKVVTFSSAGVAINASRVSYVNTAGNTWTASYTAVGSDTDGAVTYSIVVGDLAGNPGVAVTTGTGSVTFDDTDPARTSVTVASNNSLVTHAKSGNAVTVELTTDVAVSQPVVVFKSGGAALNNASGRVITYTNTNSPNKTEWSAAYTVDAADTDGLVSFDIDFSDLAGNAATTVTSVTDTSSVVVDTTVPTLTSVSIASDFDADNTQASVNHTIKIDFVSNETIADPTADGAAADPADLVVTFMSGGVAINASRVSYTNVSDDKINWTAQYVAAPDDTEGAVSFTVAFKDISGNAGTDVTAVTNSSSVTFDRTAPTLSDVGIVSNNSTDTLAIVNDVITVTFTAIEAVGTKVVTFSSAGVAIDASRVCYVKTTGNILHRFSIPLLEVILTGHGNI